MCAEECQKAFFPKSSFQVSNVSVASSVIGVVTSTCLPFTTAEIVFLAKPSEIDFATSRGVTTPSNSRMLPSGRVILIILES